MTIKYKDIELSCGFFGVSGNGSTPMGMLDFEKWEVQSVELYNNRHKP